MTDLELLDSVLLRMERQIAPQPLYDDDDEFYAYEPLPARVFLEGLAELGPPEGRSFFDLGCGIGTKLALAHEAGWNVYGCDIDPAYVRSARRLVPEAQIRVADARTVPLDEYDVVYMFQLAREHDARVELELSVRSRMRRDAVAFFPHAAVAV